MKTFSLLIFLACFACVMGSAIAIPTLMVTTEVVPAPAKIETKTPDPAPTPGTFEVSASRLYVRDRDGEVSGYLEAGEVVQCMPTESGWCLLENGKKVWAGCLLPNPLGLGCEAE